MEVATACIGNAYTQNKNKQIHMRDIWIKFGNGNHDLNSGDLNSDDLNYDDLKSNINNNRNTKTLKSIQFQKSQTRARV